MWIVSLLNTLYGLKTTQSKAYIVLVAFLHLTIFVAIAIEIFLAAIFPRITLDGVSQNHEERTVGNNNSFRGDNTGAAKTPKTDETTRLLESSETV